MTYGTFTNSVDNVVLFLEIVKLWFNFKPDEASEFSTFIAVIVILNFEKQLPLFDNMDLTTGKRRRYDIASLIGDCTETTDKARDVTAHNYGSVQQRHQQQQQQQLCEDRGKTL